MNIQLSAGMAPNPRTWPLFDGRVKADGIDLIMSPVHASELFWRQLRFADFDLSDMSFSSLLIAIAHGDKRWVGLPIFTTRRLFHTGILVRRDAGIDTPADLKGKRVAVPEYQQTAALWTRGALITSSASHRKIWNFGWNAIPSTATAAPLNSPRRRA